MIENLINFVRSRTFIYSVSGVVLLFGVLSLLNYLNDQKNQEEFLQFVEINEEFSNETETAEDLFKRLDLEYQNFGYELITKSVLAKKALDEESFELALKIYKETSNQGLVTTLVKGTTIRITPPLIIKSEEIKKGIKIISDCLDKTKI